MKTRNLLLVMAAAGLLISAPACKKKDAAPEGDANQIKAVAQAIEETIAPAQDWKKEDVNSLLAYVPADTPMVIASTRQIEFDHPFMKNMLSVIGKAMDKLTALDESLMKNINGEEEKKDLQTAFGFLKEYGELAKDFKANAPKYGLNPEHSDSIVYVDDDVLVIKQTVDDGDKLKEKVDALMKALSASSTDVVGLKDVEAGGVKWQIFSMKDALKQAEAKDNSLAENMKKLRDEAEARGDTEAVARYDESIKSLQELQNGGDDSEAAKYLSNLAYAIHYDKNVVTFLYLIDESKLESYARVLKPNAKPLDKAALGKISDDTLSVGFIDNVHGLDKLLSGNMRKLIEDELLSEKIPAVCDAELKAIAADYPRVNILSHVADDKTAVYESTLVYNDKASLAKIRDLHARSLEIVGDKTLLGVKFNLDLGKVLNQTMAFADALSQKNYQCDMLASIAGAAKELPALAADPQFAMVKNMVSGISGLNVALDKLELGGEAPVFEVLANVTGSSVGTVAPMLIGLLGAKIPGLTGVRAGAEAPSEIDLTELAGMPLKVNAFLTQTDLLLGTQNYDLKAVSAQAPLPNQNFLELSMDMKLYKTILNGSMSAMMDDADEAFTKQLSEFMDALNMRISLAVGTNDEGLVTSSTIVF